MFFKKENRQAWTMLSICLVVAGLIMSPLCFEHLSGFGGFIFGWGVIIATLLLFGDR